MNYRSILKQNQVSLLLIALAFPVSVTTSSLYAATTDVSITQQQKAISGVIFDGAMNEPLIGANVEELGTRFPDMSEAYSERMQQIIKKEAQKLGIPLKEGVYLQLTGPSYETPAEIRMYRTCGADAVGMSTACETIAARHMGIEVCGISCITNLAAGMTSQHLNHQEVQQTADRVAEQFQELLTAIITHV